MRKAGAVARTMLVSAASQAWNVDAKDCRVENGYVLHTGSDKKIGYGELAEKAATLPVPQEVTLKEAKDFTDRQAHQTRRLATKGQGPGHLWH
jgi:isoquinoline 1-oxidoreductase beta subunit